MHVKLGSKFSIKTLIAPTKAGFFLTAQSLKLRVLFHEYLVNLLTDISSKPRILIQHNVNNQLKLFNLGNVFKHFIVFRVYNVCSKENFKKYIIASLVLYLASLPHLLCLLLH